MCKLFGSSHWHAEHELRMPRVHVERDYKASLGYPDEFECTARIVRVGRSSLTYGYEARRSVSWLNRMSRAATSSQLLVGFKLGCRHLVVESPWGPRPAGGDAVFVQVPTLAARRPDGAFGGLGASLFERLSR